MKTKLEMLNGEDERTFMLKCGLSPAFFAERVLGLELKPFHLEWFEILSKNNRIAISAPTGFGKCFGKGTKIRLFDGNIKNVEDITPNDLLMGDDSTPRKVISTIQDKGKLFLIEQKNGESYVVNEDHILTLVMNSNAGGFKKGEIIDISIKDYLKKSNTFQHCAKGFKIGIEYPERELYIEPYWMGLWLGDGTKSYPGISNIDLPIIEYIRGYANSLGLIYSEHISKKCNLHSIKSNWKRNGLLQKLKDYNLINNKHIPPIFKFNSKKNRLLLLAGLIDSDGYTFENCISITQKNEILANDIIFLSRSLGFKVSSKKKIKTINSIGFKGEYIEIIISGFTDQIPCLLARKKCSKRKINKNPNNTGIKVKYIGEGDYYGFEIEGDKKRFLLEDFTVVHNTQIFGIAYPIWLSYFKPGSKALILSKTIRTQSATILEEIKKQIEDNEILMPLLPTNKNTYWTKEKVNLSNKSLISYSSYSKNIRGSHIDYLFADEVATYLESETFFRDVLSRLGHRDGKMAAVSTPVHQGDLLDQLVRNPGYYSKVYPAIVNGESIWPERFPMEKLMRFKVEQGDTNFEKNYMCNPKAESENAVFPLKNIMACLDYDRDFSTDSDGKIFIACDLAISDGPKADFDAYTVIDKTDSYLVLKHIEIHRGLITPSKVRRIHQLVELYKKDDSNVTVIVDESNIGPSVINDLRMLGIHVLPQSFHSQARHAMLSTLRTIIDARKLLIPRCKDNFHNSLLIDELITQLINFAESKSKTTGAINYLSKSTHDDIVMSLVMGVKEATKQKDTGVIAASCA